ncbi:hypothetical protein ACLB2K_026692 [Fragaria x ananassa]
MMLLPDWEFNNITTAQLGVHNATTAQLGVHNAGTAPLSCRLAESSSASSESYKSQSGTGGGDPNSGNGDGGSKRTSTPADTSQDVPENGEVGIHSGPQIRTSKSVQGSTLCVNDLCEVLDWEGTGLVVARGKISAVDPTTKVHGYNLGPDCYRVAVEEAVVP